MSATIPSIIGSSTQVHTCFWKIKNFTHCIHKENECIESPSFIIDSCEKTKWILKVYPRGVTDDKYIGFSLDRQICDKESLRINVNFEVSLLDVDNSAYISFETKRYWFEVEENYGLPKFIRREEIFNRKSTFLPQDTLTIRCLINLNDHDWTHPIHPDPKHHAMQTIIAVDRMLFTWTISDFESLKPTEQKTALMEFTKTERFSLSICYVGNEKYKIELRAVDYLPKCFMTCQISVVGFQQQVSMFVRNEHVFEDEAEEQVWQFPQLITKRQLMDIYPPSDVLTLQCEFTTSYGYITNEIVEDISISVPDVKTLNGRLQTFQFQRERTPDNPSTLSNDLTRLYRERKFCDVTLRTKSKVFPVHKAVLCSRSPVFCAMLECDIKEKTSHRVELPELDDDTVDRIISFLYTDSVKDLQWSSAVQLYYASGLYEILPLKSACSSFLKSKLSSSNVCEIIVLADIHQDEDLNIASKEYIFCHGEKVVRSENWRNLEKSHPHLTSEIFHWMYLKKFGV